MYSRVRSLTRRCSSCLEVPVELSLVSSTPPTVTLASPTSAITCKTCQMGYKYRCSRYQCCSTSIPLRVYLSPFKMHKPLYKPQVQRLLFLIKFHPSLSSNQSLSKMTICRRRQTITQAFNNNARWRQTNKLTVCRKATFQKVKIKARAR